MAPYWKSLIFLFGKNAMYPVEVVDYSGEDSRGHGNTAVYNPRRDPEQLPFLLARHLTDKRSSRVTL